MELLEKTTSEINKIDHLETSTVQLPDGIKIRHVLGTGGICDGPVALGGTPAIEKCSIQCALPTLEELIDIRAQAIVLHKRIQQNNSTQVS